MNEIILVYKNLAVTSSHVCSTKIGKSIDDWGLYIDAEEDGTYESTVYPTSVTTLDNSPNNIMFGIPKNFEIEQNFPNPFNNSTKTRFGLPEPELVMIEVYNINGQKIEILLNKSLPAGHYEVKVDADNLSSGVYLYRIQAGEFQSVKKMILLK